MPRVEKVSRSRSSGAAISSPKPHSGSAKIGAVRSPLIMAVWPNAAGATALVERRDRGGRKRDGDLFDLVRGFPHWFRPHLSAEQIDYAGRQPARILEI